MWEIHCRTKQTGRNLYLFAPVAFAMKVTALHLWSIFTPKSGANAKEREGRMYFDVAQRFAALIAGVRQTSLKLSAKASAGLPRSVRGYAGLWQTTAWPSAEIMNLGFWIQVHFLPKNHKKTAKNVFTKWMICDKMIIVWELRAPSFHSDRAAVLQSIWYK